MQAPAPARAVLWLPLLAFTMPLAVGMTGVGDRDAGATSGSPPIPSFIHI
jgi:hypothetical protein